MWKKRYFFQLDSLERGWQSFVQCQENFTVPFWIHAWTHRSISFHYDKISNFLLISTNTKFKNQNIFLPARACIVAEVFLDFRNRFSPILPWHVTGLQMFAICCGSSPKKERFTFARSCDSAHFTKAHIALYRSSNIFKLASVFAGQVAWKTRGMPARNTNRGLFRVLAAAGNAWKRSEHEKPISQGHKRTWS